MADSIVRVKSRAFALRIIKLKQHLVDNKKEYEISKQLSRSGTSIGANIAEANHAVSKREFLVKMNIALKEAAETEYWLELLRDAEIITEQQFVSVNADCNEIKSLLVKIVKTTSDNLKSAELRVQSAE